MLEALDTGRRAGVDDTPGALVGCALSGSVGWLCRRTYRRTVRRPELVGAAVADYPDGDQPGQGDAGGTGHWSSPRAETTLVIRRVLVGCAALCRLGGSVDRLAKGSTGHGSSPRLDPTLAALVSCVLDRLDLQKEHWSWS